MKIHQDGFELHEIPIRDKSRRRRVTHAMIGKHLSKFKLDESLRVIGRYSFKIQNTVQNHVMIGGNVPISNGILAYLSARLIIASDNSGTKKILDEEGLLFALELYTQIPEPLKNSSQYDSFRLRMMLSHFYYLLPPQYYLARTLALFLHFWNNNPKCKKIDINDLFKSITGFTIKEAIIFGHFFSNNASDGLISYTVPEESIVERFKKAGVDALKMKEFYNWFSISYETFRNEWAKHSSTNKKIEKYRLNPLLKSPLLKPENPFIDRPNDSYLIPIPRLLSFAVTAGIFHTLGDEKINKGSKDFRDLFGHAFEDYVTDLFNLSGQARFFLLREKEFGKKGRKQKTCDLTIIDGNRAVLIQIKHSSLRLGSKLYGKLVDVRKSIELNIVDGVQQIANFRYYLPLCSGDPVLDPFVNVTEFEHLVIIHDEIPFLNDIIREQAWKVIRKQNPIQTRKGRKGRVVPNNLHFHLMNVAELERILAIPKLNLFDFLKEKHRRNRDDMQDFMDYLSDIHGSLPDNPVLGKYFNDFFSEFKRT